MDKQYYAAKADNLAYYGTGYVNSNSGMNYGGITTNLLKFDFQNGAHSFSGLAGFEAQGDNTDYIRGSGTGIPEGLECTFGSFGTIYDRRSSRTGRFSSRSFPR